MTRLLQNLYVTAVIAAFLGAAVSPANADSRNFRGKDATNNSHSNKKKDAADSWNFWGKDATNNSHSNKKKDAIDASNVAGLVEKWTFDMSAHADCDAGASGPDDGCSSHVKPTVADGVVYWTDFAGNLWAVDADDGSLVWKKEINDLTGLPPIIAPERPPFKDLSRNSPAIDGDTLYLGSYVTGTVIAVNRADGSLKWKTLVEANPLAHITGSLVVHKNAVYVGVASSGEGDALGPLFGGPPSHYREFRGSVVALNKQNGKVKWKTDMIPEPPAGIAPQDWFSGVAVWGSNFSIDPIRQAVYVTTGNNYYLPEVLLECIGPFGADPEDQDHVAGCLTRNDLPDNYVDSIVSLKLSTGKVNWAAKLEGYDPWTVPCSWRQDLLPPGYPPRPHCPRPAGPDHDFAQGAMIWTANVDGEKRDLVGAASKHGTFWALDRDTGQVVWANEDGTGGFFGGSQWGSATNGELIVVPNTVPMTAEFIDALPAGAESCSGSGYWRGIDAATGITEWFSCGPLLPQPPPLPGERPGAGGRVTSAVSISHDVVFAGALEAHTANMVVLDLSDGTQIRTFPTNGVPNPFSSSSGPSILDGSVYWTSGYGGFQPDVDGNDIVYAFKLP